jgi:PAS domain S-box-containing protein
MPLCDAHGRPFALLGVYDDITEHKKTEEMLREKSVLLAKVINSVPDFIFAKDTKLRDIICNEAYASAVGKKPEEMIGHTDIENGWDPELVCGNPAKGIRGFENDDRDALSGKTIHNSYDPANTPNGVLIFDTYKMPLRGKDGEIIGMLGISRNITESKRAEETLRESERKKHAFFDRTFQLVGLTTTDGILIEANKTSLEFSGVEASSVLNKPFWQGPWWAHSPELQEKLRQAVVKAACGESIRFEATHVDKNGMLHYVDFSLKPVKDETGKVIFLIPEGSDITGRKKAENALRESEERYKNLFMANIDGMLVADATTKKFRYANPAICRMLGYSEEEFTQMGVADIHPKESLERVIAEFEAMASGAKITAKDLPCVRKDGQVISVNISTVTVMMDQTKYMLGIFHDITERKSKGKEDFS